MKDSWLTWVALSLVSLLVVWNVYTGATVQELGIPGLFSIKFGQRAHQESELTGSWKYELHSNEGAGRTFKGSMDLSADGSVVSGSMDNPDQEKPGEKSPLTGTYVNGTLTLARQTNQRGVTQEYHLMRTTGGFSGSFENVGQPAGPYKDSGTFEIRR